MITVELYTDWEGISHYNSQKGFLAWIKNNSVETDLRIEVPVNMITSQTGYGIYAISNKE